MVFQQSLLLQKMSTYTIEFADLGKIFCHPSIQYAHHGEPKTLKQFLKKQYWRGGSCFKAWLSQGCSFRDLPSLIWPLSHLPVPISGPISNHFLLCYGGSYEWLWVLNATLLIWSIPAYLLAIKNGFDWGFVIVSQLASLYSVYALARAHALIGDFCLGRSPGE
jgi:hypothetical protein